MAESWKGDLSKQQVIAVVCGIVAFFVVGTVLLNSCSDSIERAQIAARNAPRSPAIGDEAIIRGSGPSVFVANSESAFRRLDELAYAGDQLGIARMVDNGSAGMIENGTHVRVIGRHGSAYEVRIMNGPHAGNAGFVAAELVTSQ